MVQCVLKSLLNTLGRGDLDRTVARIAGPSRGSRVTGVMSTTTRLVFWVFGDDHSRTVGVDIALNKDVGDLKEAIIQKKKSALGHLPADALDLWKVSVPFDDDFEQKLKVLDLNTERPLLGRRKLDSLFSHKSARADDCLDIVVKVPTGALHKRFLDLS